MGTHSVPKCPPPPPYMLDRWQVRSRDNDQLETIQSNHPIATLNLYRIVIVHVLRAKILLQDHIALLLGKDFKNYEPENN